MNTANKVCCASCGKSSDQVPVFITPGSTSGLCQHCWQRMTREMTGKVPNKRTPRSIRRDKK